MTYSRYNGTSRENTPRFFSTRSLGVFLLILTSVTLISIKTLEWLAHKNVFALKRVRITGNQLLTESEVMQLVDLTNVKNLLRLNVRALQDKLETHDLVRRANVSRRLPSELFIEVTERKPIAVLKTSELIPVDETGALIENHSTKMLYDYPVISNLRLNAEPMNENSQLMTVLNFLNQLRSDDFGLYSEVSEISYSDHTGIYFSTTDGAMVYWGDPGTAAKTQNWRLFMREIIAEDKDFSNIEYFDARFSNRVIIKPKEQS